MRTREELADENSRLRAALRDVEKWAGVRETITRIREEAGRSVVPDFRAGLLLAAGMLEGGL
jgi:hypothetical protein